MKQVFGWRGGAALAAVALLLALAGCAGNGPAQRDAKRLQEFQSVAGEPVASFRFWTLHRWEGLGREHLAVWTRINTAYLIKVHGPCSGLDFATSVGLTSSDHRVYQKFDEVVFADQRCRIAEIRPVDVAALKKLRAEAETT